MKISFLIAIVSFLFSCKEKNEPNIIGLYKFTKVNRLPNQLVYDTNHLTIDETIKLKSVLKERSIFYVSNEEGNIYLKKDKIQDYLLLQFWILAEEL